MFGHNKAVYCHSELDCDIFIHAEEYLMSQVVPLMSMGILTGKVLLSK